MTNILGKRKKELKLQEKVRYMYQMGVWGTLVATQALFPLSNSPSLFPCTLLSPYAVISVATTQLCHDGTEEAID